MRYILSVAVVCTPDFCATFQKRTKMYYMYHVSYAVMLPPLEGIAIRRVCWLVRSLTSGDWPEVGQAQGHWRAGTGFDCSSHCYD